MLRSFVDSGVLIDAARLASPSAGRALQLLGDPDRTLLTSPFVYLETVPKAEYMRRSPEIQLYDSFFRDAAVEWCKDWQGTYEIAREQARRFGMSAVDALHVAAAHLLGAHELVTTERPEKAIHRTDAVRVVYLYAVSA
jgi:hypothetical protein